MRVRDLYSVVVRSHGGDITPNNNVLCCATAVFLSKGFCYCNLKYRKSALLRYSCMLRMHYFSLLLRVLFTGTKFQCCKRDL